MSDEKHFEECLKPFALDNFEFDLQRFGHHGGKGGKALFAAIGLIVGLGVGFFALGLTGTALISSAAIGASIGSYVWSATNKPSLNNNNSDVNIQRFDKAQEQMSYGGNIPVVYGMRKISGNQTYHKTNATQQKLHKHVVLCEGGIKGIESVSANELLIPTKSQSSNSVFTLQNVKYQDATVSLSNKTLTLKCNGKSRSIRLYNKDDFEDNPDLTGTVWEWQTSIHALVSYINRLGDGWQAFPVATTSKYPGDMGIIYGTKEVHAGKAELEIDFGTGDNCKLPNQKWQIKPKFYGGLEGSLLFNIVKNIQKNADGWYDYGIVGIDPEPPSIIEQKNNNSGPRRIPVEIRKKNIYRGRRGVFVGTRQQKYLWGHKFTFPNGATRTLSLSEEQSPKGIGNSFQSLRSIVKSTPIYKYKTIYIYEDYHTVNDSHCYMKTCDFTCSTVLGGTTYAFHDCEAPSNYNEVGGYPKMAWLDMNFVVSDELNGNPNVSVICKGKKVLNLKTGKTEYSTNPAWCLRDFIVSKRYGLGKWFTGKDIDKDSWIKAADYCDEKITFTNADGSRETAKRYELNMVIDSKRSAMEWLQEMLANFCGYLVFSEGKLKLKIERPERVSYKFNDDNCFNLSVAPLHLSETPNQYKVKFIDPLNNWSSVSALCEDLADQKIRQKIVTKEVSLEGVTSQHQALRLARFYRDYNLVCPLNVSFSTGQQALHLEPGDVVTIDYHGVFKDLPIRITEIQETEKGEFQISGRQYNDTIYTDELGGGIHWYDYSTEESPLTGVVPPPVNLALAESGYQSDGGQWINSVTAKWDNPAYSFIDHYEVSYSYDNKNFMSAGSTKETKMVIPNTLSSGYVQVRVKTVNTQNRSSVVAGGSLLLKGKNVPPEPITEFVVGQYNEEMDFILGGKVPNDADFDKIELRMDGSDWSTAKPVCFFTDFPYRLRNVDLPKGKHIFRVKSIDTQGNQSANDTTFTLDVRNSNTFKNIIIEREDVSSKDYELNGLLVSETGAIVNPWNITFDDFWSADFDRWWYKRLENAHLGEENEPLDMYNVEFPDVWTESFDTDYIYNSLFDGKEEVLTILSSVIDTKHIGLTGLNFIFDISAKLIEATFEDIWGKTFEDYWTEDILGLHSDTSYSIYLRFSKDGEQWTDWQPYLAATYDFRYVQYRIEFTGVTDSTRIEVNKLQQYYDVPDLIYTLTAETDHGNYHVDFDNEYYEVPEQISCVVIGQPAHIVVQNLTTKGCDIYTYNDKNEPISTKFSLTVRGW